MNSFLAIVFSGLYQIPLFALSVTYTKTTSTMLSILSGLASDVPAPVLPIHLSLGRCCRMTICQAVRVGWYSHFSLTFSRSSLLLIDRQMLVQSRSCSACIPSTKHYSTAVWGHLPTNRLRYFTESRTGTASSASTVD